MASTGSTRGIPAESEIGASNVYRVDAGHRRGDGPGHRHGATERARVLVDEQSLYVADTGVSHVPDGPRHIRRYDVDPRHDGA